MIHMDPKKIEKIRAIANDVRGNEATRAVAQAMLEKYAPAPQPRKQPPNPRLRHSEEYALHRFMDLNSWPKTVNGNRTFLTDTHRVVLFKHKRTPTFGYMLIDQDTDYQEFSTIKYATIGEAHRASWNHLQRI